MDLGPWRCFLEALSGNKNNANNGLKKGKGKKLRGFGSHKLIPRGGAQC